MTTPDRIKAALAPFRAAAACVDPDGVRSELGRAFAPDARLRLCHPFGDLAGPDAYWSACLGPLHAAMPDLERRDMIVTAGTTPEGQDWIGCMGNYMGAHLGPFLGIPPTGHLARMINGYEIQTTELYRAGVFERASVLELCAIFTAIVYEARKTEEADERGIRLEKECVDLVRAWR